MNPSCTGTPAVRARSATRRLPAKSRAMGFSQNTARPAPTARAMSSAWVDVGVTMTTASTPAPVIAARISVVARSARASARPRSAAAGSGSATVTTRTPGMPSRFRRCVSPMRPAPSRATPKSAGGSFILSVFRAATGI